MKNIIRRNKLNTNNEIAFTLTIEFTFLTFCSFFKPTKEQQAFLEMFNWDITTFNRPKIAIKTKFGLQ